MKLYALVRLLFDYGGPFFNLIGSILVAFSFGKNLGGAYQETGNGKKVYLASFLHPSLFKIGLPMIVLGSLLTLLDKIFPHFL
ncbi:MAG: hypothetical protein COV43_08990 [Deltaproteobacteria bacterium CG11_big_fil_rev_8_21_14_0_20_42_23]|nr:MAG: hypothetical protein COV43_08990 [Deltaproteobacteria bacterium CG11_big_fil_rev_8_21_14_0_20_42_23]PJC63413.1 MAG: hypothetical protein CO021_09600 [Deltaproteobacteria bacterium CG_4_9_14_0_2_um_filter_42_21]